MAIKPNSVVRTYCALFLGEQMLLVVLANNSGLLQIKNKQKMSYKKTAVLKYYIQRPNADLG